MIKKVYIPKPLVRSPAGMARAIKHALDGAAKGAEVDFGVVTQTWDHRPAITTQAPDPATRVVGTDDDVFAMLDRGTRPHSIVARRGKRLAFAGPFQSKTLPRQIASRAGSRGSTMAYPKAVEHPGTVARAWTATIAEKWSAQLPDIMQRAIDSELS